MKYILFVLSTLTLACGDVEKTNQNEKESQKATSVKESPAKKPSLEEIKKATKTPQKIDIKQIEKKKTGDPDSTDPLLNPELAKKAAPANFNVLVSTTKGDFLVEVHRDWAPNGVDQFYSLVKAGYYTEIAAFRVIGGFMAQFGMHGDPEINTIWRQQTIQDDPVRESNTRGYVTFAKTNMPNSRSTQLFINFGNNKNLDSMGFAPIGKVVDEPGQGGGMSIVDSLYADYGEGAPRGKGPNQGRIGSKGNEYLKAEFPNLDYIKSIRVCGEDKIENAPEYCP